MHLYDIPMVFVLVGLALYVVLGGADFGAAVWQLTGNERVREHAHESMAPVWEANHVWLIFVLTVFWTSYPVAFGSIASTLCVALFIAALGIIARGAAYALRAGASTRRQTHSIDAISAGSSVLAPFALGAAAGGIASRRVPVGNAAGDLFSSWLNPTSITIGVLAVVSAAYMAAVFLAADAARGSARDVTPVTSEAAGGVPEPLVGGDLVTAFRRRALGAGVAAGVLAVVGIVVVHADAKLLYHGLVHGDGLAALIVSALAGVAAIGCVWSARYEAARYTASLAVAAIIAGWALAQRPLILPGLTIEHAAAPHDTLVAVIVVVLAGGAILFPSLALLFRLVLRGHLGYGGGEGTAAAAPMAAGELVAASRSGLLARVAAACGVAGFVLLTVAEGSLPHAFGVVALLAFVVIGFFAAVPRLAV